MKPHTQRGGALAASIERYPKGAQTVTGIGHEPWYFAEVGERWVSPIAGWMAQRGVTLKNIGA